jgi:hypothetical protein
MRSALFWDVTQRSIIVSYRRFGSTYQSIKSLYMLRALLDHHQALGILRACYVSWLWKLQSWPREDKQVMLETCTGSWFSINWMRSASRCFHYMDILWCPVSKTFSLTMNGKHMSIWKKTLVLFLTYYLAFTCTDRRIKTSISLWW